MAAVVGQAGEPHALDRLVGGRGGPVSTRRRRGTASAGDRAPAPRRTFSRTLRAGKMWQSWKVRAMPFCATWCTGSPVMFAGEDDLPALGLSTLVIRLKTVDLPAPLGPMTARISPGSTVRSKSSTATRAPNRRTAACIQVAAPAPPCRRPRRGRGLGRPAREHAPDALRREYDEGHEDGAEDERPQVGHLGELMLEEDEGHAAEDRADQRAGAAHDHHDEDAARGEPEEQFGRREAGKAA